MDHNERESGGREEGEGIELGMPEVEWCHMLVHHPEDQQCRQRSYFLKNIKEYF